MVACLLLGGGTNAGFLTDALLQLLAIPVLLLALARASSLPRMRWTLLICVAVLLVPMLQLLPLPPQTWTALPMREPQMVVYELLGHELPWMPISVVPHLTWLGALSLLPPLAIFLGTVELDYRGRRAMTMVVIAVGVVSVFVGLTQVSQGPASPLRFFEVTNTSEAVGFFANRNHFAALLYTSVVFAAAWAVEAAAPAGAHQHLATRRLVFLIASFTALVMLVAAQGIARSRAGLGLTIVALFGGMALAFADRRTTSGVTPGRLLAAATVVALLFVVQFALYRLLERFDDPLQDSRVTFARLTLQAAKAYMPFGAGVGTFVPVYAQFEKPKDALIDAYVNRAHNDILEVWLEAGVAGLALMALFLVWLTVASVSVWRRNHPQEDIDLALARAASVVLALIAAHSFVDYPLRTAATMAIAAFACGLLVTPKMPLNALRATPQARAAAALGHPPELRGRVPGPQPTVKRWGADVRWPKEWRRD